MRKLNRQTLSKALNALFIVGTFAGVVYFAFQSGDVTQIGQALHAVNPWWLLGALGCFVLHAFFEGAIVHAFFRFQHVNARLGSSILVGLIGMYYSAITPAATGGQPMQVYAFKKRGVPPGIASSALAVKFFCWQSALLLMGGLLWAIFPEVVGDTLKQGVWFLGVGFFANGVAVVLAILLAVSRNAVRAILIFMVKLAHKVRIVKDVAQTSSKWDAALMDFHASVDLLTGHPFQFLVLFLMSALQVTALMSAVYFVYRGFGLSQAPYIHLLTIQLMLHIAASFTPLPGASGAQEGGFYLFFGNFFPSDIIFAALLVWRFVTYYASILAGFAAVLMDGAYGLTGKKAVQAALEAARAKQEEQGELPPSQSDDADEST
ncbi:MAG TPA: flippase-like domain-containing protein [Clostridiales bacterium]|nr:flippase-like domain-containing protein [Clostridiales bacterium]